MIFLFLFLFLFLIYYYYYYHIYHESLNDADIISMPMFATCRDGTNCFVHEKSRISICFSGGEFTAKLCRENFSWKRKLSLIFAVE